MKAKLLKAAGLVGLLTLMSRILGMVRDIMSAKSFGTTWQWDAFIYAFMLPNLMRRLVGEGALASAFIPIYAQYIQKEGEESAARFANVVFTLLFWSLTAFLLIAQTVVAILIKIPSLPPLLHLTCQLLQVLFPYLFFISLCALAMGILNCHHHFFSPALSPIILDAVWIAGALWVSSMGAGIERQVFFLSICILISGAIQLAVQIPPLIRAGYSPRFIFDFSHPGLHQVARLVLPAILGFAVVQVNTFVDMSLGLSLGAGANSSLFYGSRLMQFPLGVFATAMGTALLPAISHHTARKEMEEAKKALSFALRSIFFIILPSTVGLIALRTPIVQLLFERGHFDAVSTARTAFVTLCYTIGLFAYSGQKIIVTGFYSLQDTKTPMQMGIVALVLNIVLNLILMVPLKEGGLALATSISGIVNFFLLVYLYNRRVSDFPLEEVFVSSMKILAASLIMGFLAWQLYLWFFHWVPGGITFRLLVGVFGSITLSSVAYIGFCLLFKVSEVHEALQWFRSRKKLPMESAGDESL